MIYGTVKNLARDAANQTAKLAQWGETLFKSMGACDKVAKAAAAYFSAAEEGIRLAGGPESAKKGFAFSAKAFREARTVFGLFNVFTGKIPSLIGNFKTEARLFFHMTDGESVKKTSSKASIKLGEMCFNKDQIGYVEWYEKFLGIVIEAFSAIESASFIAGFGGFRPVAFFSKMFEDSKTAKIASDGFFYLMMIRHVTIPVMTLFNVVHETIVFKRLKKEIYEEQDKIGSDDSEEDDGEEDVGGSLTKISNALRAATGHYIQVIIKSALAFLEKGTEVAKDVIFLGRFNVHPVVMVSLNVGIGTFSLVDAIYKAYHATDFHDAFVD
ncbi:MAG: hypothetical protein KDK55_01295 [Chlamydiia bacterium]|nr:hypothetical protein [Chlamydiia bacterium]